MTHISEREFTERHADPWLRATYPNARIEEQHYVDYTGTWADYWIELGSNGNDGHALAVEVGNDESVRDECAQALEYAGEEVDAFPYVILPAGHGKQSVVRRFRQLGVVIKHLPTE